MKDNAIDFTTFCQLFQRKLETHYEAPWPLPTDWAEETEEDGVDIREAAKSYMGEDLFNSFIYGDKEQWLKTLNEITAKQLRSEP